MFKLLNTVIRHSNRIHTVHKQIKHIFQYRTFLSHAYYCSEVWDQRFKDRILEKVNLDELYNELDQKYQKTRNVSAVDVDIFANAIKEKTFADEMLDLLHKLRMSADTGNTLNSTAHAAVRVLLDAGKIPELLAALDDRLNYGLFVDYYTANLLLDTFWKMKDYTSGARVASLMMLQEDLNHSLCASLSLIHCINFLLNPMNWPELPKPEEPEEEVKIRIGYLRNPYDDGHFDLRDPLKIVGKTIMMITESQGNTLEKSLHLLGLALYEQDGQVKELVEKLNINKEKIYEDVLKLLPDNNTSKSTIQTLQTELVDLQQLLQDRVRLAEQTIAEKDISMQCDTYLQWEQERHDALQRQHERLLTAKRIANAESLQKKLKEKEKLLWYFDNEEKIELQIEEKKELLKDTVEYKKKVSKTDEDYIPPEVYKKYSQ